jgi:ribonuclease E
METAQADEDEDKDEEEAVSATETEERRSSQRRKRRRRRGGRGDDAMEGALLNGAMPVAEAESSEAEGEEEDGAPVTAEAGAAGPVLVEDAASQNGSESDQESQFRRNRRRGRRGGRRHRDEIGGEFAKQPGDFIPGLGDQPVIPFDAQFPKSAQLGPVMQEPESRPEAVQDLAFEAVQVLAPAAIEPQPETPLQQPEAPLQQAEAPQLQAEQADSAPAAEVPEVQAEAAAEALQEPAPVAEAPVVVLAPKPKPRPKPVRTSPARKGWWQKPRG